MISLPTPATSKTRRIGASSPVLSPAPFRWPGEELSHATSLSQSGAAAASHGIDFFDPSAVRAANCRALQAAAASQPRTFASMNRVGKLPL